MADVAEVASRRTVTSPPVRLRILMQIGATAIDQDPAEVALMPTVPAPHCAF
ncbi:MAG: hypothetical protein ACI9R3_006582 [Verrucomicrobiales bacterium]|jgi:hypothetical protein